MIIDQFYRNILECQPQIVLVATPLSGPDGDRTDFLIEYVNPAWETITGSRIQTVQGKLLSQTVYARSTIPWITLSVEVIADGRPRNQVVYSEIIEKWLAISAYPLEPNHVCLFIADATEEKQGQQRLKEQNLRLSSLSTELASSRNNLKVKLDKIENLNKNLELLAYYDSLTALPNRTRFTEILGDEIETARRSKDTFALAMFDVDNLKNLNDTLGHESGDELLKQVAQRVRSFENADVQASRFGGDEFLILLRNCDNDAELLHLVNSVQEHLREPYMIFNAEIKSSVSIGVTVYPGDAENVQDLLKYADIAMTDAKRRGKNTVSLFHSVMQENLLARLNMEKRMIQAFEEERFQLFFQPQIDVCSRNLRGFEALVRWFDPELGYVSPDKFIPMAEENRIIIPLGDWILRSACRTLRDWQDRFGFTGIMSVNVSPVQLQHIGFVDELRDILADSGIRPQSLEIEITEGIFIENFGDAVKLLNEIKTIGVGISLDDFGTGYSSLSYLQFLPLTTLKIDKSFIANITKDRSIEYDITDAIVTLVNKLGLDTIAEGVETDEQLTAIKHINCKTIQGYLTGRPMPREDCEKLL